jgi:hypothetical protein
MLGKLMLGKLIDNYLIKELKLAQTKIWRIGNILLGILMVSQNPRRFKRNMAAGVVDLLSLRGLQQHSKTKLVSINTRAIQFANCFVKLARNISGLSVPSGVPQEN